MAKSVLTYFLILKPTMNKWVQYPAQTEAHRAIYCAYLEPLAMQFSDRRCNRIGLEIGY